MSETVSNASHRLAPAPQAIAERAAPGAARVYIEGATLLAQPGESLLETLERHDHNIEFQCRSGYCGACRTPLLAGRVHYPDAPLAFVSRGECLPCCCQPLGTIRLDLKKTQA